MRELTGHKVNPANDVLKVLVHDEPGAGGANHQYSVDLAPADRNKIGFRFPICFQNGPISEVGVNGLTHEVLLAILLDRLESFQAGPFSNDYNLVALSHLKIALRKLQSRTIARMERGVEGTHLK